MFWAIRRTCKFETFHVWVDYKVLLMKAGFFLRNHKLVPKRCPSIGPTLQARKSEAPLWGFAFFDPDFLSIDGLIFGTSYGNVQVWIVRKGTSLHHTQSGPCSRVDRCIFDCQVCVMCPRGSKLFDVNVSLSRLGSFGALWIDSVAVRLCMKTCYSCTTWGMCQC